MRSQVIAAAVFASLMASAVIVAAAWKPHIYAADLKPKIELEALIPKSFGDWKIDPSVIPLQPAPDLQKVLDATYDQTLARTYRNPGGQRVMLSIAYGRNQHEGMNTHRPEVCYPAQGLAITRGTVAGSLPFHNQGLPVFRLVATQGARNEPITYWLRVGDELTSFGRGHKIVALEYGVKGLIPDGILVRVSSIESNEAAAFALQERFIGDMLGAMSPAARVAVLGRAAAPA